MNRSGILWGAGLIVVGVLLLLRSLGIIQIDVWGLIWPTALILAGVSVVWGALRKPQQSTETEQVSISLQNASKAQVKINFGAGQVRLIGGAGPNEILNGSFEGGVEQSSQLDGETLKTSLRMPEVDGWGMPWTWGGYRRRWDVSLNSGVDISLLDVNAGASESELDLSSLRITELKLNIGASSATLTLPANAGNTRADIGAGAASVKITIPSGVAARIWFKGGAATFNIDLDRFLRHASFYESANYEAAANKLELKIDAGAGSIEVR
jgi:Domain of unknown function (DUF5668)/N-terminal domain of toast_rack, DUF2154